MTAEGENEMVAQTAKSSYPSFHFDVTFLIVAASKNLCTLGMTDTPVSEGNTPYGTLVSV